MTASGPASAGCPRKIGPPCSPIPDLRAELQRSVDTVNAEVSRAEQIKRFAVLLRDWSPDTGELTPTLKVRRKIVLENYATEIEALYGNH